MNAHRKAALHYQRIAREAGAIDRRDAAAIILGCLAAFIFGMVLYAMQNGWAL